MTKTGRAKIFFNWWLTAAITFTTLAGTFAFAADLIAAPFDGAIAISVGKEYYDVEIFSRSTNYERIDAYARIETANGQIGFGDGTVDLEHFIIIGSYATTDTEVAEIIAKAVSSLSKSTSETILTGKLGSTIYIFYPAAASGSGSTDGYITTSTTDDTWANKKAEAGSSVSDSSSILNFNYDSDADTDDWDYLRRNFITFNTASLDDGATIAAATVTLSVSSFSDNCSLSPKPSIGLYDGNLADPDNIAVGDMLNFGTTLYSNELDLSTTGPNIYTLNSTGRTFINKTGVTDFALIDSYYDIGSNTPNWVANCQYTSSIGSGDGSSPPYLTIEITVAPTPECGNGLIESGEECDDGDTSPGDGCDASCDVEDGWTCSSEPSVCTELLICEDWEDETDCLAASCHWVDQACYETIPGVENKWYESPIVAYFICLVTFLYLGFLRPV